MKNQLDKLFNNIVSDCLKQIDTKHVDIDDLSFKLGMDSKALINCFTNRNEDFSIYLRAYDLLVEW